VDFAHRAGDAVLEAKAMATEAEIMHALAVESGGDPQAVSRAAAAAKELISFCLARKDEPDFLLINQTAGSEAGCMMGTCEAHAWLNLARLDIAFHDAPAAGRRKLTGETLRLLARVEEVVPESRRSRLWLPSAAARGTRSSRRLCSRASGQRRPARATTFWPTSQRLRTSRLSSPTFRRC
jgi:hypothetical protein